MVTPRKPPPPDLAPTADELRAMIQQHYGMPAELGDFRDALYYTSPQVAARLNVNLETLRRWRKRHGIPYLQVDSQIRYLGADLNAFIQARKKCDL